jgi:hypothetical protein
MTDRKYWFDECPGVFPLISNSGADVFYRGFEYDIFLPLGWYAVLSEIVQVKVPGSINYPNS